MLRETKRRGLLVTLLTCLLAVMVAAGGARSQTSAPSPELTLQQAVAVGLRQGEQAQRARITLQQQLLEAADLWEQHRQGAPRGTRFCSPIGVDEEGEPIMDCRTVGGATPFQQAQFEEIFPMQVEMIRQAAQAGFIQQMAAVRSQIADAYINAVLAQERVRLAEDALQRARLQHEQAQAMAEQGVISELELAQVGVGVAEAEAEREAARQQAEQAVVRLNLALGNDLSAPVRLPSLDALASLAGDTEVRNLADDLEAALAASAAVLSAEGRHRVAQRELELFRKHHGGYEQRRSYRQYALAVEEAALALAEAKRSVERDLRELYGGLREARARRDLALQHVALAERNARVAQLRVEAGLSTVVEAMEAELALLQARLGAAQAQAAVYLLGAQLNVLLGEGVDAAAEEFRHISQEIEELR